MSQQILQVDGYPSDSATYSVGTSNSGSANTKGAYVQVIPSMPFDGYIELYVRPGYAYDTLLDIAIGAAGSELVVLSNLIYANPAVQTYGVSSLLNLPFIIPSGTRIAVRSQNTGTDYGVFMYAIAYRPQGYHGLLPLTYFDTYGAATADSGGTAYDPGSSANTKGGYLQITPSLTNSIRGFFLGIGSLANTVTTTASWKISVGIGGEGSEVDVVNDWRFTVNSGNHLFNPRWSPIFWTPVVAGTRMAVNAQCSITDATDRKFDVVLYGVR
jgi:hypothetical protein